MVLGLEEGLVECATLCVKSWVILKTILQIKRRPNTKKSSKFSRKNKSGQNIHNPCLSKNLGEKAGKFEKLIEILPFSYTYDDFKSLHTKA